MALGKTIQIFLPDGNPRSLKIAEITSRTVQAILIPRAKLDDAARRGTPFIDSQCVDPNKPQ